MSEYHTSVLLNESVSALVADNPCGIYADATFGGGGHSREILSRLQPSGRLVSFDRDADAFSCRPDDERLTLIRNNFRFIHNFILAQGYTDGIDGIIADLGVSSHQFDTADRGFSFRYDAPLDMRMNSQSDGKSARDVVNSYDEQELERILRLYGEVQGSRRMAALIVRTRTKSPIVTTLDLVNAIKPVLPSFGEHKVLSKVFQAFRIEVNDEMLSLEKFLYGAAKSLKTSGRLVVITYHSLEDRMVKNFMKSGNVSGEVVKDIYGKCTCPLESILRKPLEPSEEEISSNPRARSAKMRVAVKL